MNIDKIPFVYLCMIWFLNFYFYAMELYLYNN